MLAIQPATTSRAAEPLGYRQGNILNILVLPFLVTPIGDFTDTVFILVHRYLKQQWIRRPLPFPTGAQDDEWEVAELRGVRSGTMLLYFIYTSWAISLASRTRSGRSLMSLCSGAGS
jgi:hypothetical protein